MPPPKPGLSTSPPFKGAIICYEEADESVRQFNVVSRSIVLTKRQILKAVRAMGGRISRDLDGADYYVADTTESELYRVLCPHRCSPNGV